MMRILVADDEKHICEELEYILKQYDDFQIVASCSAGDEALDSICRLQPDIVFLDIAMPGLDGIKLGHYLKNLKKSPYIIYITAYDEHAVEAFKVGAKGYVLKPFTEEEIKENLENALKHLNKETVVQSAPPESSCREFTRISAELNGKFLLLDQEDILMIYAENRSVYIRCENNFRSNFSLTELEKKLNPNMFFRCHRNYIINLYRIKEVAPWFNNTYLLRMDDETTEVPVSRTKVKELKVIIGM